MNIAIIGYGKMGREIQAMAIERGHNVALIIDNENIHELNAESLSKIDVAIEFSTPQTAFENIKTCLAANTPVVSGTTGWHNRMEEVKALANKSEAALFYASNFSIGVNLFFKINRLMGEYLKKVDGYSVALEEIHHMQKKDAPSGTAISLAEIIAQASERFAGWTLLPEFEDDKIPIKAIREGDVTGTHTVCYNSGIDELELTHRAKNRKGFAMGAILAGEFSVGKKGFLTMDSLLQV
jgi:4-hydroxy-tetrahydrodipicolinate reductase